MSAPRANNPKCCAGPGGTQNAIHKLFNHHTIPPQNAVTLALIHEGLEVEKTPPTGLGKGGMVANRLTEGLEVFDGHKLGLLR